jgi:hypothetical protein
MSIEINDCVRLVVDLPDHDLYKGRLGVVVAEFLHPEHAYEVEFSDEEGETIAQIALLPKQFETM